MNRKAYLITNVEEYGKFAAFCINNDVTVWRTYWNEKDKGDRCYNIDWKEKRCYYGPRCYYENEGYEIVIPNFTLDVYGDFQIERKMKEKADEKA